MSDKFNKLEALKREIEFLSKLGITYNPFNERELTGMLFNGDVLVGYILEDEMGDLKTQISSDDITADYSCDFWGESLVERRLYLNHEGVSTEIYNIETDNSDFLSFTNELGEGYAIIFEKNKISCGKSNARQNIILNGQWYKGRIERANNIIDRFREITPGLIDSYFSKYIDTKKEKMLV